MLWGNKTKELSQGYRMTTNNRMELMAVVVALKNLTKKNIALTIYTDSQYVVNTVTKGWLKNWLKTGFKGKKNKDLWLAYHQLAQHYSIKFQWVKGHANNVYNNRCDVLATTAADSKQWLIDDGYEMEDITK
jgi:ribonuclease HI